MLDQAPDRFAKEIDGALRPLREGSAQILPLRRAMTKRFEVTAQTAT